MRLSLCSAVCALCLLACVAPMPGCQNSGLSSLIGKDAMELLSPLLKDAANSYLTNINALVDSLGKVHSLSDAVSVAPKIEPAAKDAGKAYKTLSSATPEERKLIIQAFGPKIDSANSGFLEQTTRVKGNSLWGQALNTALDQVKLYATK